MWTSPESCEFWLSPDYSLEHLFVCVNTWFDIFLAEAETTQINSVECPPLLFFAAQALHRHMLLIEPAKAQENIESSSPLPSNAAERTAAAGFILGDNSQNFPLLSGIQAIPPSKTLSGAA